MLPNEYTLIIKKGQEGYFIGSIVELPGCHVLGKNTEEIQKNIKKAIEHYLEVEKPESSTELIGIRKISL